MLRGLIIRHHLVQIAPVHVRAKFWVRESFSAGRARSAIPAKTRDHYCVLLSACAFMYELIRSRLCVCDS